MFQWQRLMVAIRRRNFSLEYHYDILVTLRQSFSFLWNAITTINHFSRSCLAMAGRPLLKGELRKRKRFILSVTSIRTGSHGLP